MSPLQALSRIQHTIALCLFSYSNTVPVTFANSSLIFNPYGSDESRTYPTYFLSLFGKIRSYGDPRPCKIIKAGKTDMTVEFDEPQFAPCPGQILVLYNGNDNVVAGGTITA